MSEINLDSDGLPIAIPFEQAFRCVVATLADDRHPLLEEVDASAKEEWDDRFDPEEVRRVLSCCIEDALEALGTPEPPGDKLDWLARLHDLVLKGRAGLSAYLEATTDRGGDDAEQEGADDPITITRGPSAAQLIAVDPLDVAFLALGASLAWSEATQAQRDAGVGQAEFTGEVIQAAETLRRLWLENPDEGQGCWYYEVSERLGKAIGRAVLEGTSYNVEELARGFIGDSMFAN